MLTVIAYDIADDRRRNEVSSVLADHGRRVNYSVFECELDRHEFETLRHHLSRLIDVHEDRILFYRLCEDCRGRRSALGQSAPDQGGSGVVMI